MFIRKYDTPKWISDIYSIWEFMKYKILRPILAEISYYFFYRFQFKRIFKTFDGKELKPGISVYIPMKDEDTFLMTCLESLLDIADQFILIDNGSSDRTLDILYEFQKKYVNKKDIVVLPLPDKLLVELVQIALEHVKHEWVLKWDGDMVAVTEGNRNLIWLRNEILHKTRPAAYTLPRYNLCGDFSHVSNTFAVIDKGEPFLRTFNNAFRFQEEYGRIEHAVIPKYYQLLEVDFICSIHLSKIRPLLRLIYREMYLDWRQVMNRSTYKDKERFADFEFFKTNWKKHNFGTIDDLALKYRIGRLFAAMSIHANFKGFELPTVMKDLIAARRHKFEIDYRDGKPYRMHEIEDEALSKYKPSAEDDLWTASISNYYTDKIRLGFTELYRN